MELKWKHVLGAAKLELFYSTEWVDAWAYYRVIELFKLKGTSGGHLVKAFLHSR